jgi:hypothetical protein
MTNEERDLIEKFVARVGGASSSGFGQSVPATQPGMAPIDPEADRYIAQQFQTHPEARYRITQMAVVQEAALAEAANRIQRLQAELETTRQQAQQQQSQPAGRSGGFLGGLFGGSQSAPPQPAQSPWNQGAPPQQQQYSQPYAQAGAVPPPPGVQPGMFSRGGSGFLGSALSTAAGVAGGVVAGNVLMDMFSGHGGGGGFGGGFGGGGFGGGGGFAGGMPVEENTTIVNNYGDAGQQGGGGWDNATQGGADPAWDNSAQADPGGDQGGGWDDNSGGGGFDDTSI